MYSWACPSLPPPKMPHGHRTLRWETAPEKQVSESVSVSVLVRPIPAPISAQWVWLLFPYFPTHTSLPFAFVLLQPGGSQWPGTDSKLQPLPEATTITLADKNNTKISIHKQIWCCSLKRSVPFNITFRLPLITPHMFCKQNKGDHLDNTLMSKRACWHPLGKKCPSAA